MHFAYLFEGSSAEQRSLIMKEHFIGTQGRPILLLSIIHIYGSVTSK